jgi:hypothetical protein
MRLILLFFFLLTTTILAAQATSFKFDFGLGKAAKGYTKITPESKFSYENGFGFDQGSQVVAVETGGNALTGDYITR